VLSGQVPPGSTVIINLQAPIVDSMACPGGVSQPHSCTFRLPYGAPTGAPIGRQDFRVSPSTPLYTHVYQIASVCGSSCQAATVNTQGPGAIIGGTPPPPPPSFPFATKVCAGENEGGTASAGQVDYCQVSASVGNSYSAGQSVIVKPFSPSGTTLVGCVGHTAGSYATTGSITPDGYCRLTVASGIVPQFELLGTEAVRLSPDAMPGLTLLQWVNFCNAPNATGDSSCLAVLGVIPVSGPGASVSPDPAISGQGVSITATEAQPFSGTVAGFSDPDPHGTFTDYVATIDWGDGTASTVGTTGANAALASFDVTGTHTYREEGQYTITVYVTDIDTPFFNSTSTTSTAVVADAPLSAAGVDANSTNPFNGTLATFSDANPNGTLSDFSASIDWGDNTSTSGTVNPNGGSFAVSGVHTYANLGPYTVAIHVCDVGGSCADATTHLLIYGLSGGGNFVIGDGSSSVGASVTFWSAQWASANPLSGGVAPDSFKGFAHDPATPPDCGTAWSTSPGNSASPPASVPTYVAVIVASSISNDGPRLSGDSVKVVVVETDAGYAADPGHAGTGTVVAQLC
jgi:hypothetical protein